jgi:hypothetical protein
MGGRQVKSIYQLIEETHQEATVRQLEVLAMIRRADRERRAAVAAVRLDAALRWGLRLAGLLIGVGAVLWVLHTIQFHP